MDGVGVAPLFMPVLTNMIMAKSENDIAQNLLGDRFIEFNYRFINDILVLIKQNYVSRIYELLNNIHKNLGFTIHSFGNEVPQLLDTKIPFLILQFSRKVHPLDNILTLRAALCESVKPVGFTVL